MAIVPKRMDPEVLHKFMELKKNNNDAYTELLSHILWMEQSNEALSSIIEAIVIIVEHIASTKDLGEQWEEAKNGLRNGGIIR